VRRLISVVIERSLLLIAGTIAALAWANAAPASYAAFAHRVHFAVNDIAMVFFFALATKEIVEATHPGGALASWREAAVPLFAAAGGMLVPALMYTGAVAALAAGELHRGWAIPCATDIAFSYMTARLIFPPRHPAIPFLLLLAVADDALGLIILAIFYPAGEVRLVTFALLLVPAVAIAWALRRRRVESFWPYVLAGGALSWTAFYVGGLHPALALVPIVPFLPHEPRKLDLFADPPDDDATHHYEHEWNVLVQAILFLFGLVNAGVLVRGYGTGTWALLIAALVGRPLGLVAGVAVALGVGLKLPPRVGWREVLVLAFATSSGFTFALFFATGVFPIGPVLTEVKIGALATAAGAALAFGAAHVLRVGRYAR
jgi:Na+:H+ antiporter, NhaA family